MAETDRERTNKSLMEGGEGKSDRETEREMDKPIAQHDRLIRQRCV